MFKLEDNSIFLQWGNYFVSHKTLAVVYFCRTCLASVLYRQLLTLKRTIFKLSFCNVIRIFITDKFKMIDSVYLLIIYSGLLALWAFTWILFDVTLTSLWPDSILCSSLTLECHFKGILSVTIKNQCKFSKLKFWVLPNMVFLIVFSFSSFFFGRWITFAI